VYSDKPGAAAADAGERGWRSSNTAMTFPTRLWAIAGWRTRTSSYFCGEEFFNVHWCLADGQWSTRHGYSCGGVCQHAAGLYVRSTSIDPTDVAARKRQGHRQESNGNCHQSQAVLAAGAGVRRQYRLRADFVGIDALTLEVRFPGGKTEVQRINITVGSGSPGRST
jgi:hypothetical protein